MLRGKLISNSDNNTVVVVAVAGGQTSLEPGHSSAIGGFVIISNYFSPANPAGSLSTIGNVAILVGTNQQGTGDGTITAGSGMVQSAEA